MNSVGSALNGVGSSIGGWFSDLGNNIGGFFNNLWSNISGGFKSVTDWFGTLSNNIGGWFQTVFSDLGSVLDYLNPWSDKFILKVAFVPSQDFMDSYKSDFNSALTEKFAFFYELSDSLQAMITAAQSNIDSWQGVSISLPQYGVGTIHVIDPQFANLAIPKIKFWIGGLMYFLTGMWIIRKVSNVLGAGKG